MVSCCWPTLSDNWFLVCDQLDMMPGDRSQVLQAAFLLDPEKGCSQAEGSSLNGFYGSLLWLMHLCPSLEPASMIALLEHLPECLPVTNILCPLLLILHSKSVLFMFLAQNPQILFSDPHINWICKFHIKGWHFQLNNKLDQEGNRKL